MLALCFITYKYWTSEKFLVFFFFSFLFKYNCLNTRFCSVFLLLSFSTWKQIFSLFACCKRSHVCVWFAYCFMLKFKFSFLIHVSTILYFIIDDVVCFFLHTKKSIVWKAKKKKKKITTVMSTNKTLFFSFSSLKLFFISHFLYLNLLF